MSIANTPQRVLIVDDESDLVGVLGDLFVLFGYEILTAANGELACAILDKHEVDVVLTDVRMPVMDGIQLVREIRRRDRRRPIVMVTSGYSDHLPEVVYDAGANGFLPKPFGASGVRDAFVLASIEPSTRWSRVRTAGAAIRLSRTIAETELNHINLGTGGMYWALDGPAPDVGQMVDFDIDWPGGKRWRGQGIVRWTRAAPGAPGPGCGIEFTYLDDDCRAEVIARIDRDQPTAFLPRQ